VYGHEIMKLELETTTTKYKGEVVMSRDVEEVEEWVVGKLDNWLKDATYEDEVCGDVQLVQGIRYNIQKGNLLNKEQATWLKEILENHLERAISAHMQFRGTDGLLLQVDTWSIYSDAWGMFCRSSTFLT